MTSLRTLAELEAHLQRSSSLRITPLLLADKDLDKLLDALEPREMTLTERSYAWSEDRKKIVVKGKVDRRIRVRPLAAELHLTAAELTVSEKEKDKEKTLAVKLVFGEAKLSLFDGLQVPASARWLGGAEIGAISTEKEVLPRMSVKELAKLISRDALEVVLPLPLQEPFKELRLTRVGVSFDLTGKIGTVVALKSTNSAKVTLHAKDPTIELSGVGIALESEIQGYGLPGAASHAVARGGIEAFGALDVGQGGRYRGALRISSEQRVQLTLTREAGTASLPAVALFVGGKALQERAKDATQWLEKTLRLRPPELGRLVLDLELGHPGRLRQLSAQTSMEMALPGADKAFVLEASVTLPDLAFELDLRRGDKVPLKPVLAALLQDDETLEPLPAVHLEQLRVLVAYPERTYELSLGVAAAEIRLGFLTVELTSLALELRSVGGKLSLRGAASVLLNKSLLFSLAVSWQKDRGFLFKGVAAREGKATLKDLLAGIQARDLQAVPGIYLVEARVWFAPTAPNRFGFEATLGREPEQKDPLIKAIQGRILIEVDVEGQKSVFTGKLEGSLVIGDAKLSYTLDLKDEDHRFVVKGEPHGKSLDIRALAEKMGWARLDRLPPGVGNLGLKEVGFTYSYRDSALSLHATSTLTEGTVFLGTFKVEEPGAEPVRAYAVGVSIKGPVSIKDIPFVGAYLGNLDLVELEPLRLIVSSRAAKAFRPPGEKKDIELKRGLSLQGKAKIGAVEKEFNAVLWEPAERPPGVEAAGADARAGAVRWIELQQNLGPLQVLRIGFQIDEKAIGVHLDGGVELSGVMVRLYGLAVRFPPGDVGERSVGLDGVQVGFEKGPLQLRAGLLRTADPDGGTRLDGEAVVMVNGCGFAGLGSFYQKKGGPPALFVYIYVGIPFGDPSFTVKGLAGGFGIHSAIVVPPLDKLQDFALMPGAKAADLRRLREQFPVRLGNMWFAAGIKVSSFEMLSAFVLPVVSFGVGLEVAILGTAEFELPGKVEPRPISVQMVMYGGIHLAKEGGGSARLMGTLTRDSYILVKEGRIEGGFALCWWFAIDGEGQHKNDFLFTVGGYHPLFEPPAHYPRLAAAGFNCSLAEGSVSLKGTRYLAVTNSCVMIGGRMEMVLQWPSLRVWLEAHADIMIGWLPFHATVKVGVTVGIAAKLVLFGVTKTIAATFAAQLDLVTPKYKGTFRVNALFLNILCEFGEAGSKPPKVTWGSFKANLLDMGSRSPAELAADGTPAETPVPFELQVSRGLRRQVKDDRGRVVAFIVDPADVVLTVSSKVPAKTAKVQGVALEGDWNRDFGVGLDVVPHDRLESSLTVRLEPRPPGRVQVVSEAVKGNVPRALWSIEPPKMAGGAEALLLDVLQGVRLGSPPRPGDGGLSPDPSQLRAGKELAPVALRRPGVGPRGIADADPRKRIADTIVALDGKRRAVLGHLMMFGIDPNVRVDRIARGEHELAASPILETLERFVP